MDWYSWLSKTSIEPTLVYEYGLTFARNQLQEEDLPYFNHEFLQSIGIHIAKHRLQIIRLVDKEVKGRLNASSRLSLAVNNTKKLFTRNLAKLAIFHKNHAQYPASELSPRRKYWNGASREMETHQEKEKMGKNMTRSGPLDLKRMQEKWATASRGMTTNVSGPLNHKGAQERFENPNWSPLFSKNIMSEGRKEGMAGFMCRSPTIPGGAMDKWGLMSPCNYQQPKLGHVDDHESLWYLMFQDMKPT